MGPFPQHISGSPGSRGLDLVDAIGLNDAGFVIPKKQQDGNGLSGPAGQRRLDE